jgi:hypothetical protein
LTSAPYVVTLDADDRLKPTYLEITAARLDLETDLAFVSTAIETFGQVSYTWTPPIPTVTNAFVRGAPHPATMFRRETWLTVGGFDESPAVQGCEDLAFWLSVMEHGFRGDVLLEPLLEYRVRPDSVHQQLVAGGRQAEVMAAVFRAHSQSILKTGTDLLLEKERFLEEQRRYQADLADRKQARASELETLEEEIARVAVALSEQGAWGEVDGLFPLSAIAPARASVPLAVYYFESFLKDELPDTADVLLLADSDDSDMWPNAVRAGVKTRPVSISALRELESNSADWMVAPDLLRTTYDARGALLELYRVLRPGGTLLCGLPAVHAPTETGINDYWRFAEAVVRRLFAEVFPLESFRLTGYGNVMACAAVLAGLAADELQPDERDIVDPMFPVLYSVRAVKQRLEVTP